MSTAGEIQRAGQSWRHPDWLILGLLAISVSLNVAMGSVLYSRYREGVVAARLRSGAAVGDRVSVLELQSLEGAATRIDYRVQPLLVYVMNPSCVWCDRNLQNISALAPVAAKRYRLVAISTEPTPEIVRAYVQKSGFTLPTYVRPSSETVVSLAIGSTPQTLLIDTNGRVEKAWPGAYIAGIATDIESFFELKLPGLTGLGQSTPKVPK
jgi:hypothetical protein